MDEAQPNDARGAGGQREACARTDQGAGEAPSCPESDCLGASLAAISGAGEGDIAGGACSRIARYLHALVYVDKIRVPERGNARILKPRPTLRLFGMRDTHANKSELPTLPTGAATELPAAPSAAVADPPRSGAPHTGSRHPPRTVRDIFKSAARGRHLSATYGSASWAIGSRDRSNAKAPAPADPYDHHIAAVSAVRDWLAANGVDRRTRLSARLRAAAARGDALAQKIVRHVIDRAGEPPRPPARAPAPAKAIAPVALPRVAEMQRRSAEAHRALARDVAAGLVDLEARVDAPAKPKRGGTPGRRWIDSSWDRATRTR